MMPSAVSVAEIEQRLLTLVGRPVRTGDKVLTLRHADGVFWVEESTVS
jgi:hypothetical protein